MESTGQAPSWRPGVSTYRCFLPDLTGFAGSRRTRPNRPNPSQALREILPRRQAFGKRGRLHFRHGEVARRGEADNPSCNTALGGTSSARPATSEVPCPGIGTDLCVRPPLFLIVIPAVPPALVGVGPVGDGPKESVPTEEGGTATYTPNDDRSRDNPLWLPFVRTGAGIGQARGLVGQPRGGQPLRNHYAPVGADLCVRPSLFLIVIPVHAGGNRRLTRRTGNASSNPTEEGEFVDSGIRRNDVGGTAHGSGIQKAGTMQR